jgi:hypothetical protein
MGAHPASEADKAAWRKAGSPHVFLTVDGKRTTTSPEKVTVDRGEIASSGLGVAGQVSLDRLRNIPTDPVRLRSWLLALPSSPSHPQPPTPAPYIPGKPHPVQRPPQPRTVVDQWLFEQGADLILYAPISPKARAATFRMLAQVPGVKLIGTVHDADGRKGTAVGMDRLDPMGRPDTTAQHRLIVDPGTGEALADEDVILRPNDVEPGLPAGAIASTNTVLKADWTDTQPKLK